MGMILNFFRVTPAELETFINEPELLEGSIYDEATDEENPNLTDIDKSWDGILFLLTGTGIAGPEHPLRKVMFSGQEFGGDQDMGYGPAQYLTPEQVQEVHMALRGISAEDLRSKYDPKRMTELDIYPSIWQNEEEVNYLLEYYEAVREIYATAAANGEAVITFIN